MRKPKKQIIKTIYSKAYIDARIDKVMERAKEEYMKQAEKEPPAPLSMEWFNAKWQSFRIWLLTIYVDINHKRIQEEMDSLEVIYDSKDDDALR